MERQSPVCTTFLNESCANIFIGAGIIMIVSLSIALVILSIIFICMLMVS